jgi:hypothetical protein
MFFRIFFFLVFFLPTLVFADDLKITRINPSGEDVAADRQIVFEFNKAVVPIGRMERTAAEIPIVISPALNCEWRWINTSSLACQLSEADQLKLATKYEVTVSPGIVAVDGSTLSQKLQHSFITQRPVVKYTWFNTWKAPGWPVILVSFDQKVNLESVSEHLFFESEAKRFKLKASIAPDYSESYLLLEPLAELPADSHFSLTVEPGITGLESEVPGIESRKIVEFDSFGAFKFIGIRCYTNDGTEILTTPSENAGRCNPTTSFDVVFSSPVIKEELQGHIVSTPDLAGGRKDLDPWEHVYSYSSLSQPHYKDNNYGLKIPILLKAFDTYQLKAPANKIKDEFGRELEEEIEIKFDTDHRPAKYVYESALGVLEKDANTEIPIFVTNLESINLNYSYLTSDNVVQSSSKNLALDKIQDIAYLQNLGIRDLLSGKSGVVWGTFDTQPNVNDPRWFMNQVTPYQVHAKLGHFNSVVWVTNLKDGQAVEGANVEIFVGTLKGLEASRATKASSRTDLNGIANLPGLEKLDPNLTYANKWDMSDQRLFVRVQQGSNIAVLPIHYEFNSYSYGTYGDSEKKYGHVKAWGTTAQGVYRAGDTIDYKLYVRNQNTNSFSNAPAGKYKLEIIDPLGKTVSTVDNLSLNQFGAYDGTLRLSENAAVGWYNFQLSSDFTDYKWQALNVLVSDFTPSPFKVTSEMNGKIFESDQEITVSTLAKLHSGGPYLEAPVRITANLSSSNFSPIEGYDFGGTNSYYTKSVFSKEAKLDDMGELDQSFTITDDKLPEYGNITVESAVRDDRGKYVAATSSAKFYSRDRFVGIKLDSWVIEKSKPTKIEAIVVDQDGKNQTGTNIEIQIEREDVKASRVKGAGNAYLTKYVEEWVVEDSCKLFSTEKPQACTFTPKGIGNYRITAKIEDTKGREQLSSISRWAIGDGQTIWDSGNENKLEVVAEKAEYKLGDKARFLIKNPFPGAKALFTIERYGILKSWTSILKNSSEIIEFEIERDHLPGIYFSALVVSPRVADAPVEGDVDLGKPTYRMGYATLRVEDDAKRIKLAINPEKQTYKPRDEITVDLKLDSADIKSGDVEIAVAVLDEAVFDLVQGGTRYFDPYLGFYQLNTLDVVNYNILSQLIGLRKIEKKGANAGGDGGKSNENRNIFKYVSYWNPSLKLDGSGKAKIKFTAPDNLTGWRVLALAVNKTDRMGLGQANFKVNKETEIRPANPNQVIEGDSFVSKFTVMNRSEKTRSLKVILKASGAVELYRSCYYRN